ncbi:ATP-dependent acyl-CoA ligase [Bradyrhizobium sp. CCBAU 53351]|uniref:AMP-binding protein n=1 Tax=Bradyrhizobium sp. CCBAU 53351 TaxID=1325114 RepID=UPI00188957D2|nr:AMP-binding protein [Bradyrhizobium sp. CCBAU 53351]QOZ77927.1 ATP-dependent acyl-CoA ligase [Bradyrhizobium sp. CCBAU 53351]
MIKSRRVPDRSEAVLRCVLERRAAAHPERPFLRFPDGSITTYGEFCMSVQGLAAGLASIGVKQGDNVNVWMPNTVDVVRAWFAINWLGAVYVPINTAYRGSILSHVLMNGSATVLLTNSVLLDRLREIDRGSIRTVVVAGLPASPIKGINQIPLAALDLDPSEVPPLTRPIEPWDPQSIIHTSGTTGRSKGVVSSYAHIWHMSGPLSYPMLNENDSALCFLPFFHIGGTLLVSAMLNRGGAVGLGGDFTTDRFWPIVHATKATYTIMLGAMSSFLAKPPPTDADRNHTLRNVTMIPLPGDSREFAQRFGVDVWTLFNMTEVNTPIVSDRNPAVPGTCGKARPGNELLIVDEHDRDVAPGEIGELIIRSDAPWALNSGYFKNPDATAHAWRNGWFHTGDAFRTDENGNFFFVDRIKNVIPRRDENISSFEVQAGILAHPVVSESVVVAAPNELAEDNVLAAEYRRDRLLAQRARECLKRGHHSAASLAEELNLSMRTLYRRLREEGTSLQALKDEARRDKAIDLLRRTEKSIKQIAQAVGFQSEKSFARAFQSWTGSAPTSYRSDENSKNPPGLVDRPERR